MIIYRRTKRETLGHVSDCTLELSFPTITTSTIVDSRNSQQQWRASSVYGSVAGYVADLLGGGRGRDDD